MKEIYLKMFEIMLKIRIFEEKIIELFRKGDMTG